jgi:hypothetical protein
LTECEKQKGLPTRIKDTEYFPAGICVNLQNTF